MTKQVVITGATGGLGRGVVAHFLAQGDQVLAVDVHADGAAWLAQMGHPAGLRYRQLNVTDYAAVQVLADDLRSEPGYLDVLVNLVGGFQMASLQETSVADLDTMLELNVRSTFNMSKGLLPLLLEAPAGRIINVGARQALTSGPNATAYALSKAAVVNFTQSLAAEIRASHLTVNAVVPSIIDTPMNRQSMPDANFEAWVKPADLAAVIAFLASEAARAVNGAVIPVYHKS